MIIPYQGRWPKVHETAFVAPSADVIGDVEIGAQSSIWFQAVVRGDVNWIRIGDRTNVQDGSVLHVTRRLSPLRVGDEVTVGHNVTLHGCVIGKGCLIGMGAVILDDAEIGENCMVGAGSLITRKTIVPAGQLVLGAPARVVRPLKPEELAYLKESAANYVNDSKNYIATVRGAARLGKNDADLETPELLHGFGEHLARPKITEDDTE
jgi:carbonic anhydrase/acetyltransferase-like protein (isoleucine patch superfamily)